MRWPGPYVEQGRLLCFEGETFPTSSFVSLLGPQLVALFLDIVELLEMESE